MQFMVCLLKRFASDVTR